MKKKQVMSRGKRAFWLVLKRVFAASAAAILAALAFNSVITVEINGHVYRRNIALERKDSFEESSLFREILEEELDEVTRMAVIMSQLETDGEYNGSRQIDVAKYAHRQEELPDITATAPFYLDDLVKWGNYGFVTEKVCGTLAELNSYFANGSSPFSEQNDLTAGDWRTQSAETRSMLSTLLEEREEATLSMRMISELPSTREEYIQMARELGKYTGEEEIVELNVLVPRYLSAEGKDLAEYAADADEYVRLREDLKQTSRELFYNFSEYSENRDHYAVGASNLRYCYRMVVDGENRYYSNLDEDFRNRRPEEITELFQGFGRYISYNADRAQIDTNTSVSAERMRQTLENYQYAFGDNTRVWLAVDTSYPVEDGFLLARDAYSRLMPYYLYMVAALILLVLLVALLFVHLTRYEGRRALEEGGYTIALHRADRMMTEPFAVLGIALIGAMFLGSCWGMQLGVAWENVLHTVWLPFLIGAIMFFADYVIMFFYLSMVRRVKAHTLWKNSLLRFICRKLKKGFLDLYDHSRILVRALVPFLLLLVFNLILGGCGVWGILVAAVWDVAAILFLYRDKRGLEEIVESAKRIGSGDFEVKIDAERMHGENRELAESVNGIGTGIRTAVEKSMKDERMKADLITNVSHDIKTPLTSIINFVNLLKREDIEDARIRGYIEVLDAKSQRLKQLTDDLVEASKISSGNISLQMERINFAELVNQTCGEFSDRLRERSLELVVNMPEQPVCIEADPRQIWRVVENLFSNVCKYALERTRVYLEIRREKAGEREYAQFSMKNISAQALNIRAEELTERFIRGDISRSTEGSGLGLSIAKNLTELQNGKFDIYLDGDLFKVLLTFPCVQEEASARTDRPEML